MSTQAVSQRLTERRVRIRIPKDYHQDPVISQLVSHYNVTVNIVAALLDANATGDGWFDLNLQGSERQITHALSFINDLNIEILAEQETDGW